MELYKFQHDCVEQVGTPELISRLIADDMGAGKTVEALACDDKMRSLTTSNFPTLIVAPLSVHDHWRTHVMMVTGAKATDIKVINNKDRPPFVAALKAGKHRYYICHWEALRLKDTLPAMQKVRWFHIIADECHRAKNRKAQQTRGLKSLPTQFKTGASGTPADDKPADIWSVLNWLYPNVFRSYWRHVKTYCIEETIETRGTTFRKWVKPNPETTPQLLAQIRPYYVRRLKAQILPDLPPKTYTDIFVDLPAGQRRLYNQMRKDMIAWVGEHEDQPLSAPAVIAQLVRLQQFALATPEITYKWVITKKAREYAREHGTKPIPEQRMVVVLREPSVKLDTLTELILDHEEESFVVFSQSRSMINLVGQRMASHKVPYGLYTGAVTSQEDRDRVVAQFQNKQLRVFAGTIAAGGEGITLTASSTVVFLDRHWSPTKNIQAEDRLHRVGQKDAVQVIDIMARNTIDLGRRTQIAQKWANLQFLLGDIVDIKNYKPS